MRTFRIPLQNLEHNHAFSRVGASCVLLVIWVLYNNVCVSCLSLDDIRMDMEQDGIGFIDVAYA